MIIAVDFDGTIVEHRYPRIGEEIPFAIDTLKLLQQEKHRLILWSVREGTLLEEAVEWRRGQRSATDIIQIDGFEYDNLKFVFKLGGVEKTINLDNVEKIVITEDITDRVVLEEGHPQFEPLKNIMIEIGRQYLAGIGQIPQE